VDALEHGCRRSILRLLNATPADEESTTAEEIGLAVADGPATVAYHLRVLTGDKLITTSGLAQGLSRPSPAYCSAVRGDEKVAFILSATAVGDSIDDRAS